MNYTSDFDIDLKFGELHEDLVKELLTTELKVEVKTDRQSHLTGNVYVEFESRGKPSGINITTAEYFAFVLDKTKSIIFIKTKLLKKICKGKRVVLGGDNNTSKGYLIKVKELVEVSK